VPLSDLHIGAEFAEKKFIGYRDWIINTPNAYTVINGDVLDLSVKASIGDVYSNERPRTQRKYAVELLRPLAEAGKILAYLDGNHEYRVMKDTDEYPGETICELLGIPHLYDADGVMLFLNVGHDRKKGEKNRICYSCYMLHGWAGGKRWGGLANALESMANSVVADVYIISHSHKKIAFSRRILVPDTRTKSLRWKKQLFFSSSSFQDWAGYAVRRGYNPATLGSQRLRLDGTYFDSHVSL
jgi:predicted MPP superfamily phosphohydrolase